MKVGGFFEVRERNALRNILAIVALFVRGKSLNLWLNSREIPKFVAKLVRSEVEEKNLTA